MLAPRSIEEANYMWQIGKIERLSYLWVACNDMDIEGNWRCEGHGESVMFIEWATGEPNAYGNEDCAFMEVHKSSSVYDGSCEGPAKAVCIRGQEVFPAQQGQPSSKSCFTIGTDQRLKTPHAL